MKISMIITGDERLNRKLAELKGPKAKAIIRKAARTALRPVQSAVKREAPRRTGRLAKSVKIKAFTRSRSRIGAKVTTAADDNLYSGRTFYGGFQEFGWKTGRRATNKDLGVKANKRRTTAQQAIVKAKNDARKLRPGTHFMKRAADSTRFTALEIYRHEVGAGIEALGAAN